MIAALAQIYCEWGKISENLGRLASACDEARSQGAELIVFPELALSGIYKDTRVSEVAEPIDGPSLRKVADLARSRRIAVGVGFSEQAQPLPYNGYAIFDQRGELLGVYRKNYVPKLENPYWQAHTDRPVFKLLGRRVGVALCCDNRKAEMHECYAQQNVDLLIMPHAWDADPLGADGKTLVYDDMSTLEAHRAAGRLIRWKTHDEMLGFFLSYTPGSARKHRFAALFVNQAGQPHPALQFNGPSFAVSKDGEVPAKSDGSREQLVYTEI